MLKNNCSFWHAEQGNMPCKTYVAWDIPCVLQEKENSIELFSAVTLNWSRRLQGKRCCSAGNKPDAANRSVWGDLCGMGSWCSLRVAPVGAVLLLCHIPQGGLTVIHIVSGVLVRIWSFFQGSVVPVKTNTYPGVFFISLASKAQLTIRKHLWHFGDGMQLVSEGFCSSFSYL